MMSIQELDAKGQRTTMAEDLSIAANAVTTSRANIEISQSLVDAGVPRLSLVSHQLNISIQGINGAIIGRRQGPYRQLFEKDMYVSGVHAQLFYSQENGWCIMDKHSSNGTFLNRKRLQADIGIPLKNNDILSIANIKRQVLINTGTYEKATDYSLKQCRTGKNQQRGHDSRAQQIRARRGL